MEVLKTTSPTVVPAAPIEIPRNTVPSARTNIAGCMVGRLCGNSNPLYLLFYFTDLFNSGAHQVADMQSGRSMHSSRFLIRQIIAQSGLTINANLEKTCGK